MTKTLQLMMFLAVILYFILLFYFLKKKTLNIKYTLLWIFSGFLMLLLTVFPKILAWFASIVGIYSPANALFAVISFCVICILMSLTAIVSKLNEKVKKLVQAIALLEKRVREMEDSQDRSRFQ